jgi:hypothetical protein
MANGPTVLSASGVVRNDIRPSFAGPAGWPTIPLEIVLTIVSASTCAPLGPGGYIWHCDRLGRYSLDSQGVTTQIICAACSRRQRTADVH